MANIKPINEVPIVEEVAEGDKILLNRGGVAAQIDASKVGGGGGGGAAAAAGGAIYVDLMTTWASTDEMIVAMAYTDPEMTQPMDYETGKGLLHGAGKFVHLLQTGDESFLEIAAEPSGMLFEEMAKVIITATGVMFSAESLSFVQKHTGFILMFSDSEM